MKRSNDLIIVFILFALISVIFADDIKFEVRPSATRIGAEDRLVLDFIFEGADLGNIAAPSLPTEVQTDWRIDGQNSSTSTSISLVGGRMQSSKTITHHFHLSPRRTGKLTIPAVVVTHRGKEYRSRQFEIEVVDGSLQQRRQPTTRQPATRQPSTRQPQQQQQQEVNLEDEIFISTTASKKKVYVGEPVILNFTLYNRTNLIQLGLSKDASYPGFWADNLFSAEKIDWKPAEVRGQRYNSMLIRRVALYPVSAGTKTTTPMEIDCVVQSRSRDFFDFFGSRAQVTVKSRPVTIEVLPLPTAGRPADFSNAVGEFSISMSSDRTTCQTNDAIQVFVNITGTGNLRTLDEVRPKFPAAFEVFESSKSERILNTTTGRREVVFQYVVLPRERGKFTIPPVTLSYFDPNAKQYRRASSQSLELEIEEGAMDMAGTRVVRRDDVITVGMDIAFIKTDITDIGNGLPGDRLKKPNANFFAILIPIELMLIGMAMIIRKKRIRLMKDFGYARFVGAASTAANRIKKATRDNFISEVAEALEKYIADKLNIVYGEHSPEDINKMLHEKSVPDGTIHNLKMLRANLDMARFAPGQADIEPEDARNSAVQIIKSIEKTIKGKA